MPRRPTLIRAPALIYFAHPLDPALIQGNTVSKVDVMKLLEQLGEVLGKRTKQSNIAQPMALS